MDGEEFEGFTEEDLPLDEDSLSSDKCSNAEKCTPYPDVVLDESPIAAALRASRTDRSLIRAVLTKNLPPLPACRTDSRSSTRSSELGCDGTSGRSCDSVATSSGQNGSRSGSRTATKKKTRWIAGIDDWFCPQPGEELEFYLGRVSCLLERCDMNNPKFEHLQKFRQYDEYGRIGEMVVEYTCDESDAPSPELGVDPRMDANGTVQSETSARKTPVPKQQVVKGGSPEKSVANTNETVTVEAESPGDGLVCSVSRDLLSCDFGNMTASPDIAERIVPKTVSISAATSSGEADRPEPTICCNSQTAAASICANVSMDHLNTSVPLGVDSDPANCSASGSVLSSGSLTVRPPRQAKTNWKSRLENYGEIPSLPQRTLIPPSPDLIQVLADHYVEFMNRVGQPIERNKVDAATKHLRLRSKQPVITKPHQDSPRRGRPMSKLSSKLVSSSTPNHMLPGCNGALMSLSKECVSTVEPMNIEESSSTSSSEYVSAVEESSQLLTPSLHPKITSTDWPATSPEMDMSHSCSTSTIESFSVAPQSPSTEEFYLRTLDEKSALSALMSLGDSVYVSSNKQPQHQSRRKSSGSQLSGVCAGCSSSSAQAVLQPFASDPNCLFCAKCIKPYEKWLVQPWHYGSTMKCKNGARCVQPTVATCKPCWFWRCVGAARRSSAKNNIAGCENVGLSFEADSVDDDTSICGRRSGRDSGSRDDELESFLDVDIPRRGGPRIKHVSRSQHLVVGLPLATFPITPVKTVQENELNSSPIKPSPTPLKFKLSALSIQEKRKVLKNSVEADDEDLERFQERKDYIRCKVFSNRFVTVNPYSSPSVGPPVAFKPLPPVKETKILGELKKKYKTKMVRKIKEKQFKQKGRPPKRFAFPVKMSFHSRSAKTKENTKKKKKPERDVDPSYKEPHAKVVWRREKPLTNGNETSLKIDTSICATITISSDESEVTVLDPADLFTVKRSKKSPNKQTPPKRCVVRKKRVVSPAKVLDETMAELLLEETAAPSNGINGINGASKLVPSGLLPGHMFNDHCYSQVVFDGELQDDLILPESSHPIPRFKEPYTIDPLLVEDVSSSDQDEDRYGVKHFTHPQGPSTSSVSASEQLTPLYR